MKFSGTIAAKEQESLVRKWFFPSVEFLMYLSISLGLF